MFLRQATEADIAAMILLAEQKRSEYAKYAPTFWRKAQDGEKQQTVFFQTLLTKPNSIAIVSEDDHQITGFAIGSIVDAPPVYNPGTKVCIIDGFTVADASHWSSLGSALLAYVRAEAGKHGADLTVVICGHHDGAKRAMLQQQDFGLASEWYVNPL